MSVRSGALVLAALVGVALSSCAPPRDEAADTATGFYTAIADGDGAAACAALAPAVAAAVEDDAGSPCPEALTSGDLGDDLRDRADAAGATSGGAAVRVAGRQAQVAPGTDTLFLARSGPGWVITAAACTARPDRPYDCEVAE